jgi:hypothetical protein
MFLFVFVNWYCFLIISSSDVINKEKASKLSSHSKREDFEMRVFFIYVREWLFSFWKRILILCVTSSFFALSIVKSINEIESSLIVKLSFEQKFKPDPRVDVWPGWTDQSSQLDSRIDVWRILSSLFETSYIWKDEKKFFVSSI